jgi:crotonobetainyl-CoA:carnitine CoA-transferase CaiB-like acyl-CoA transferase
VRVLDLSRVLAGPLCSMMLGDLGADVIKVERAATGDDTRGWGPPFDPAGQSAYFLSTNRNKLSLAADFANAADRALLLALAHDCDVVIENFLPGTLARYAIDSAAILKANPRAVWCTISGFGEQSERPGYDFVMQAECGWMAITGAADGPPFKVGVALADVIAGKDAAIAILAALVRQRAGPSAVERHLHISLKKSATAALVNVAQNALVTGREPARWGNAHPNLVPYQLFDASDRALVIAVGNDRQWQAATAALDLTDLAANASYHTNSGRLAGRDQIVQAIERRVATATAVHWVGRLEARGVPCGVVKGVVEALTEIDASPNTGVAPPTGGSIRFAPPGLNEHGERIRKLHWSVFKEVPILD